MDVSVLLMFRYRLGGDGTAAIPAPDKSAERFRVLLGFLPPAANFHNFLNLVKKSFGNYRRVASCPYLAAVIEVSVIKRTGKYPLNVVI